VWESDLRASRAKVWVATQPLQLQLKAAHHTDAS
jgi:hypothetical protein